MRECCCTRRFNMNKKFYIIFIFLFFCFGPSKAQTRSELEAQREKAFEEIAYVDNILKLTSQEKEQGINELRALGRKVNVRESVISGLNEEIDLLNSRIEINSLGIEMMEMDLEDLKEDYRKAIISSYKVMKTNPYIVYILSAEDFNQGYKRVKYLQQITKLRRKESELIVDLKNEIEKVRDMLQSDLMEVSQLRSSEQLQANLLKQEQSNQQKLINNLSNKETQLRKELQDKQALAKQIELAIEKMIAEERERNRGDALTPEQMLIGEDFADNKGRLPWPVERGVITNKFGKHQHPVFKYLTEDNIGIEITSNGKTVVRSVFAGEVSAITTIPGSNMTVIIRHGKYLTVYNNLVNVNVKKGDKLETKQIIGEVFSDPTNNNVSILKFMIFDTQYLDPEQWIAKN